MSGRFKVAFKDAFRVLHTLTLEVVGGFFLALAIVGVTSVVQEYQRFASDPDRGIWRVVLAVIFSVFMLGFGLHNFWKARKVQK